MALWGNIPWTHHDVISTLLQLRSELKLQVDQHILKFKGPLNHLATVSHQLVIGYAKTLPPSDRLPTPGSLAITSSQLN